MPAPASAADTPRRIFSPIARDYDRPAQLLSLLQYEHWHRFLVSRLDLRPGSLVLDMATGTGAVAARLTAKGFRVVAADITRPMLLTAAARAQPLDRALRPSNVNAVPQAQARAVIEKPSPSSAHPEALVGHSLGRRSESVRAEPVEALRSSAASIDFIECTAEAAPFADGTFDAVVFTYLLRYVSDVPATLNALARLVAPGGTMASLEFAVPRGVWYPLWRLYTSVGLPLGGLAFSPAWRRVGAFLGPSIRDFYRRWPEERLLALWRDCGFPDARSQRLSLGGAVVTWGTKTR